MTIKMVRPISQYSAVKKKSTVGYLGLYSVLIIMCILLFLRDVQGMSVSKYLFIALIGIYLFIIDINKVFALFTFLMPLYVGLPGNYITVIILFRFFVSYIFHPKKYGFRVIPTLTALGMALFILMQDYVMGYIGAYYMICAAEIILVLLLFSYKGFVDYKQCVFLYSISVAFLGIVMLLNNLKIYDLEQLLSSVSRLGTVSLDTMTLKIDPNFYGYFTIASIASMWTLLFSDFKRSKKIIMSISAVASVIVSFVGLSRTFFLLLLLWIAMVCFTQKEKGKVFIVIAAGLTTVIVLLSTNPEILDSLFERFNDSDIAGGNGRIRLIHEWSGEWISSLSTLFFGVGFFACNIHCMPLQYLFGTGLIGGVMILSFSISNVRKTRHEYPNVGIAAYIPMLLIILEALTVPAATSLMFMFPTIIALFVVKAVGQTT